MIFPPNLSDFSESGQCKNRMFCVKCRNDEKFRKNIERQLGKWECPLHIPIGTGLNDMPLEVRERHIQKQRIQNDQVKKLDISEIDNLYDIIDQLRYKIDEIVKNHLPQYVSPHRCIYNKGVNGEKEIECCGGKKIITDSYLCDINGTITVKNCRACHKYATK